MDRKILRGRFAAAMLGVSATALGFVSTSHAQTATEAEGVVVTASRITTAGFDAPTPTTVLGADLIQKSAEPNLFTSIAQLPSLQGSTGTTVNNGNTSTGATGLSALNMRGLGTIRTLTLIDGQRVVPAYVTGITDVSQFPQLLVQRVEVVTGGASASYGSDAVAGVVNFITDKRFTGFKLNLQGGITMYGDDEKANLQTAWGHSVLGGRGHLTLSGEYYKNDGAPGALLSAQPLNGRPPLDLSGSTSTSIAATPAGQPQFTYIKTFAQNITRGRNGLITAGPLQGIAFGPGGVPYTFQYGGTGVPNRTAAGGVVGCIGTICEGGELSNAGGGSAIDAETQRVVGYSRFSFDVTDHLELFATVNIANVDTDTAPTRGAPRPNLTIRCDNAFLDPSIPARCATAGVTTFVFGTYGQNLNEDSHVLNTRRQRRFVVGADGSFDFAGKPWTFNSYYQHGENITDVNIKDITLTARYNAAIDATRNAAGQIVCRSTVAQAQGCIPFNAFGDVQNSQAAFEWMAPINGPHQYFYERQDAASIAFNATPFALWAGDVAIAFGGEYREEAYKAVGDPYGAGAASTPYNDTYPADPVLATSGDNWYAGNFHNGSGRYDVKEAFIEAGVPLWNGGGLGKADLNAAVRYTDYSTSGGVTTWKIGGTWETPLPGVRLRGVRSRDIRAPNLSDLFAAPVVMNNFVTNRANGASVQILNNAVGNPALTPEISITNEVGVVFQPTFLPGFNFSVDYFDLELTDAIQALTNQQIVDGCFNGNQDFCANVFLGGTPGTNNPSYVIVRPFNLASIKTDGMDFEASYRTQLDKFGLPGQLTLRGLVTKTFNYIVDTGVSGQAVLQTAGNNAGDIPYWKAYLQQTYNIDKFSVTATERLISDGVINRNFVVCTTGCPAPTVQNPTSNFNEVAGATYVDLGATFEVSKAAQIYGKVDNVGNVRQPSFGSATLFDTIGRRYTVGVRLKY